MKINENNGIIEFIPENWKDRFKVEIPRTLFVSKHIEGSMIPPFYLPVYEKTEKYSLECWILPLAPFVLIYRIISNILWITWKDLIVFQRLLNETKRSKK